MCSGENSVPTWPFHCFDKSILTIDRSPELTAVSPRPSVKNTPDGSILESRAPTTPVALRPVSASHAPAVVSAPGVQFRKDCWHPQKPSSGRWLRRGQRFFRNWGPGSEDSAGENNAPGLPGIIGDYGNFVNNRESVGNGALYQVSGYTDNMGAGVPGQATASRFGFDASRSNSIYGKSETVMPPSINQPAILYLGRSAQV